MRLRVPDHGFFQNLQLKLINELESIFGNKSAVVISYKGLQEDLKQLILSANGTTVVSLDQIYNSCKHHLESNRIADLDTMEVIGEAHRPGHASLTEQIRKLPKDQPITLVDDGCFSGGTLTRIYQLMLNQGFIVERIIVGLVIDRHQNRFIRRYPEIPLVAVKEYENVIDWVCERDFYVGVPLSGRTAGKVDHGIVSPCEPEISLPYCLPFGDPIKGASIPTDRAIDFSRFILSLSLELWENIEKESGRPILSQDVPRLPKGVARDKRRFTEALNAVLRKL
jgi:hypothetical protein